MKKINDWTLDDEISNSKVIVGFYSTLDRRHRAFLQKLIDCERRFDVEIRIVDLVEHPSLVARLRAESLPLLVVWSHGQEMGRWAGHLDMRVIAPKLK